MGLEARSLYIFECILPALWFIITRTAFEMLYFNTRPGQVGSRDLYEISASKIHLQGVFLNQNWVKVKHPEGVKEKDCFI